MLYGDDVLLTDRILACAIEVHRHLGPGLLESIYESAICMEFSAARLSFKRQIGVPLYYKGTLISEHRPDLVVENRVIVEIKSIERLDRIHMAQMLTYLRVTELRTGLILNFNSAVLRQGIRRVIL
jgi:GxxExxY protein